MSASVGVQEKDAVDDYGRDGSCRAGGFVGNTAKSGVSFRSAARTT
jgi:hypothetical protein